LRPRSLGVIQALTEEHHDILRQLTRLFIEVESRKDTVETFARLRLELNRHFREEETILYRPLGAHLGKDSPIAEMIREHRSIQSALARVGASLKPHARRRTYFDDLRPMLDSLDKLVHAHVNKEERVLFWLAVTLWQGRM